MAAMETAMAVQRCKHTHTHLSSSKVLKGLRSIFQRHPISHVTQCNISGHAPGSGGGGQEHGVHTCTAIK